MFTHETLIRVRYAETDQMGVVYHGNYFPYFESARAESIRSLGFTYADMEKMGVMMPIVEIHTRFLRPAVYDDLLTVRTILKELQDGSRIEFHQEVYNEKKELLTTARIVLLFMNINGKDKTGMPAALRDKLLPYFN